MCVCVCAFMHERTNTHTHVILHITLGQTDTYALSPKPFILGLRAYEEEDTYTLNTLAVGNNPTAVRFRSALWT